MFNKAKKWGLIENNPTLGIELHKLQARERRLSYDEMGRFLHVLCGEKKYVDKRFCIISVIYWS
ncbi:hypothetical protein [Orientia tsutsugamushi]|uniref:hypothetical protein n=1 Tax=Orientia tsutsugamushi TaxID=784 RepID=UPI00123AF96B|nr:hypothetical protein [Orientia tsutsugamushi]QES95982.1 hypothetical protein F0363_03835 [Orientia tsutsugamushi]QES96747.1 hypothetical protein F0363_10400 [Orientia tsutsugamushi]